MVSAGSLTHPEDVEDGYRHEALLYAGRDDLLEGAEAFIRGSMAAGEPLLVALDADAIDALRRRVDAPGRLFFADMHTLGHNPARIIPAWHDFLDAHRTAARVRGIGEPIWADRGADELAECQHHEALLNAAFADRSFWLLCPYDTSSLDPTVVAEAWRTHPVVRQGDRARPSPTFAGADELSRPLRTPLPDPPPGAATEVLGPRGLAGLRRLVAARGTGAGLPAGRVDDLVLAASEMGANSLVHGGGRGTLRVWDDGTSVVCEIRDTGRLVDPWAGRTRPPTTETGGRGLWLANQLCDLVQIRSDDRGTVVRLHMAVDR
jgi:anti-sigma regulatory factor (Ser/Thr protein kinase)